MQLRFTDKNSLSKKTSDAEKSAKQIIKLQVYVSTEEARFCPSINLPEGANIESYQWGYDSIEKRMKTFEVYSKNLQPI